MYGGITMYEVEAKFPDCKQDYPIIDKSLCVYSV